MTIYQDDTELSAAVSDTEKAVCKAGVMRDGVVAKKTMDLNHYWVGPCWTPLDWSGKMPFPGAPGSTVEVYSEEEKEDIEEGDEIEINNPF